MKKWTIISDDCIGQGKNNGNNLVFTKKGWVMGQFSGGLVNGIGILKSDDFYYLGKFKNAKPGDLPAFPYIRFDKNRDICVNFQNENDNNNVYALRFFKDSSELLYYQNNNKGTKHGISYVQEDNLLQLIKYNSDWEIIHSVKHKNPVESEDVLKFDVPFIDFSLDSSAHFVSVTSGDGMITYIKGRGQELGLSAYEQDGNVIFGQINANDEIDGLCICGLEDGFCISRQKDGKPFQFLFSYSEKYNAAVLENPNLGYIATHINIKPDGSISYESVDGDAVKEMCFVDPKTVRIYDLVEAEFIKEIKYEEDIDTVDDVSELEDFLKRVTRELVEEEETKSKRKSSNKIKAVSESKTGSELDTYFKNYVGQEDLKKEVAKMKAFSDKNSKSEILNCYFYGPVGCGQEEGSLILAKYMVSAGILQNSVPVLLNAREIVGSNGYDNLSMIDDAISQANGGVILVNNAGAMAQGGDISQSKALNYFAKMMKTKKKNIFIFSSSEKDMLALTSANLEFANHIGFKVEFKRYTINEYKQLVKNYLEKQKYTLTKKAEDLIIKLIEKKSRIGTFENMITVAPMLDGIIICQNGRTIDNKSDFEINEVDIEDYLAKEKIILEVGERIGNSPSRKELDKLIGLNNIKTEVDNLVAYFAQNKDKKTGFHMAFLGNPGTGKTEVARLVGKMLFEEGLLPTNKFIECSRSDLVGEYIGWTAPKTRNIIKQAMGGVLYIDEAYSLALGGEKDFGREAIAELIKTMEDDRGDFCVILSGYTKEMETLFDTNPGFYQRVKFVLNFDDYSRDELVEITKLFLKKENYEMSDEAFKSFIDNIEKQKAFKNFANARSVRENLDRVMISQSGRVVGSGTKGINRKIELCDVESVFGSANKLGKIEPKEVPILSIEDFEYEFDQIDLVPFFMCKERIMDSVVYIKANLSEGSGFIIAKEGYIVTCAHVVDGTSDINVRIRINHNGGTYDVYEKADVVVLDKDTDLAIIKTRKGENYSYVSILSKYSTKLENLATVYLLGYPFGGDLLDNLSINEGKIASYQKDRKGLEFINLDISAKRGNSGGCIVDQITGRVVGVLCGSIVVPGDDLSEEINYARPASYIWDLIKKGQKKS